MMVAYKMAPGTAKYEWPSGKLDAIRIKHVHVFLSQRLYRPFMQPIHNVCIFQPLLLNTQGLQS